MQRYPGPQSNRQRRAPPGINPARMSLVAKGSGLIAYVEQPKGTSLLLVSALDDLFPALAISGEKIDEGSLGSTGGLQDHRLDASSHLRKRQALVNGAVELGDDRRRNSWRANTSYQLERSSLPSPNSARVGIPGSSETRLAAVIARTLTRLLCRPGTGLRRCRSKDRPVPPPEPVERAPAMLTISIAAERASSRVIR